MSDPTVTKKAKTKTNYTMPWVEKYRPLTLDQVVGNEDTITRLQAIAEDGNMPNLILSGPPGTGKVRTETKFIVKTSFAADQQIVYVPYTYLNFL